MTRQKRAIAVIGATGNQGGSVARSLLDNEAFEVRCITRDASSPQAKALMSLGASVVQADATQRSELEKAISGCYGLFVNYSVYGADIEEAERLGKDIFLAAAAAGIKQVVFSSEPHPEKLTSGKVPLDYLDGRKLIHLFMPSLANPVFCSFLPVKARVYEWVYQTQNFDSFTPIMPGWFMENMQDSLMQTLLDGFPSKKDNDGYLTCRSPLWGGNEDVPWISIGDDFGDLVHGIFLDPIRWNYRPVQAVADPMSFGEMTRIFSLVTGQKTRYIPCDLSEVVFGVKYDNLKNQDPSALFRYAQLRDGEYYGNGPTENRTASQLKKAAFKAKGGKGREALLTLREYIEREFT
ncbi:uncharacterized protein N7500_007965 [Penicillium coprophilum]|uniref:uncharacterized protein n=1 Tax=Penicillium coprophilum TaxID=36646 RepID=UPI002393155A|nr:uncharacterized protein N7500_007965 [Penicillium coprophilum]KAJ5158314.1 hypothetical protein N7500_007965 [Penicillium coprophilum]